ncbi:hypothetical protein [Pseudocolwellia agarivorans]|uniref:hypothetical protein n=1 Tax=Pseudocolwellia agarivorans TaxID=1911682 RepID=UPI003F88428B
MHVDKAKKRIAKLVKAGDKGYPKISIEYFGESSDSATLVVVGFTLEEGAAVQEEKFNSKDNARESEVIQSALVKIIERANAKSVIEVPGISLL